MKFDLYMPTSLKFGRGRFNEVSDLVKDFGKHALIVTGKSSMERLGYTNKLTSSLEELGIKSTVYNKISSNPTIYEVDEGAKLAKESNVDFIIALGGGSVIDGAKGISAVCGGNNYAVDYLYKKAQVSSKSLPLIAIPTTSGTGSELNRSAIIRDPDKFLKDGIRSDYLFPKIAIVDPELTYSLPKKITAETGFDALTHAIESYVSPKAQPIIDAFSLTAIENITKHLPIVLSDLKNPESRERLSISSASMGYNLSFVGTCFPHKVDKALCALHPEISHGQSLAIFYTYWANNSWKGNINRFANISKIMEPSTFNLSIEERAKRFPEIISDFIKSVGLNKRLSEYIKEDEIPQLVNNVVGDLNINPVPVKREDLPTIFKEILQAK